MVKVAFNQCYGGFALSDEGEELFTKLSGEEFDTYDTPRHHPALIAVIETLGKAAGEDYSNLQICEVEGNMYRIEEYDGYETVMTPESYHFITVGDK